MMNGKNIEIIPLSDFPIVQIGDIISELILVTIQKNNITLIPGDIIVVTHSIISIAEGKLYHIDEMKASDRATKIANKFGHLPEKVEAALLEASEVLREEPVFITRTKQGIITDFSGIDESNAPLGTLIALPENPDDSAKGIGDSLTESCGFKVPVIITDTHGRPWRKGAVNIAIGIAGMSPFTHNVGKADIFGHKLHGSLVCIADEIASSAELLMGQANEGVPVVIVRGVDFKEDSGSAAQIIRPDSENLFC